MTNEEKKLKHYELALKLTMNEGHILWSFSQSFLIANTIIIGFISQLLTANKNTIILGPNLGIFSLSIFGLAISILWFLSYRRRSDYYKFRAAQVRKIEKGLNLNMVGGEGKEFSDGMTIRIAGNEYRLGCFSRVRTKTAISTFIILFIAAYLYLCISTRPWHS